jgi:hypothetical protein
MNGIPMRFFPVDFMVVFCHSARGGAGNGGIDQIIVRPSA